MSKGKIIDIFLLILLVLAEIFMAWIAPWPEIITIFASLTFILMFIVVAVLIFLVTLSVIFKK